MPRLRGLAPLLAALLAIHLRADEVQLKNGATFTGTIVEETDGSLTIRVESGTMTFRKDQVQEVRRRPPLPVDPGATEEPQVPTPTPPEPVKGPPRPDPGPVVQGPVADLVARVGPGGVDFAMYDLYLRRHAGACGLDLAGLTPEQRASALDGAIQAELIFQGAIEDGVLGQPEIRRQLAVEFLSEQRISALGAEAFSEANLKAHYDAHRERFSAPGKMQLRIMEYGGEWMELGWFTQEGASERFGEVISEKMWRLAADELIEFTEPGTFHFRCRYKVVGRTGASSRSFEESKDAVLASVREEKRQEITSGIGALTPQQEEDAFRAAVGSGLHRGTALRKRIVDAWVAEKRATWSELLPALRSRFPVEVLEKE